MAILLVAGAAGVWYLNRGASELTVDRAVENFRSEPAVGAPEAKSADTTQNNEPAAPKKAQAQVAGEKPAARPEANAFVPPKPGVYVFATKGYEETDALAGQRHDYPPETSMTIRRGGCGWISRWQPLDERWEESELCEHRQGTEMKRYTMYHEFFQRGVRDDFDCTGGFVQKPGLKPGDSWPMECRSPDSTASSINTVIGYETINVGGKPLQTMHLRYDITARGANEGKIVQDRWMVNSPRLLVRMTQRADLKADSPFGKIGYKESFRIDLKSAEPRT